MIFSGTGIKAKNFQGWKPNYELQLICYYAWFNIQKFTWNRLNKESHLNFELVYYVKGRIISDIGWNLRSMLSMIVITYFKSITPHKICRGQTMKSRKVWLFWKV